MLNNLPPLNQKKIMQQQLQQQPASKIQKPRKMKETYWVEYKFDEQNNSKCKPSKLKNQKSFVYYMNGYVVKESKSTQTHIYTKIERQNSFSNISNSSSTSSSSNVTPLLNEQQQKERQLPSKSSCMISDYRMSLQYILN